VVKDKLGRSGDFDPIPPERASTAVNKLYLSILIFFTFINSEKLPTSDSEIITTNSCSNQQVIEHHNFANKIVKR